MNKKLFELDETGKVTSVRGIGMKPQDHVIRVLTNEESPAHSTHSSWTETMTSAYCFADNMIKGLGAALDEAKPKK